MTDFDKIIRGDGKVSMDGTTNAASYDAWADDYDADLRQWGYEAPTRAAEFLSKHLDGFATARVLDCGCGTGMTGAALREAGCGGPLIGYDMSASSLEIARSKEIYADLRAVDLNGPLPMSADSVDGVLCIGVLTYVEAAPLCREWIRVLRPGGVAVFTSRDDFWQTRGFETMLSGLEDEGLIARLETTGAMPYLPGNPQFGDKVRVIYGVIRAL